MSAIYTFPHGQSAVAMVHVEGRLFVATTSMVWMLDPENGLVPVEIQPEGAQASPETEVYQGESRGVA